jgi:hypothetical protein
MSDTLTVDAAPAPAAARRAVQPKPAKLVLPARPALISVADVLAVMASGLYYLTGVIGLAGVGLLAAGVAVVGRRSALRGGPAGSAAPSQPAGERKPRTRSWQFTTTRKTGPLAEGRRRLGHNPRAGKAPGSARLAAARRKVAEGKPGRTVRAKADKLGDTRPGKAARAAARRVRPASSKVAAAAKDARARASRVRRTGRSLGDAARANSTHARAGRRTWGALAPWRAKAATRRGKAWRGLASAGAAGLAGGRGARATRSKRKTRRKDRGGWRRWVGVDEIRPQKPAKSGQARVKKPRDRVRQPGQQQSHQADPNAVPLAAPAPKPAADPITGDAARQPAATGTGARNMRFHQSATEMAASATRYAPENMHQVFRDFGHLPAALAQVAASVRITTQRAEVEWPLHPAVKEALAAVHQLLVKAAESSANVAPAMRRVHEKDLARYEQPRRNERLWNVAGGGGAGAAAPGAHRAK